MFSNVLTFIHPFFNLFRFHVNCVVTDEKDVTNFLMVGKVVENVFGSLAHHYFYDRGFSDPIIITPPLASKLKKTYIFQLRFGAFQPTTNYYDVVVTNVFNDVPIEQVDMQQEQPQTSNVGAVSNTSIVVSNIARTTPSNPLTPTIP